MRLTLWTLVVMLAGSPTVHAQSLAVEAQHTQGISSESISAAGTQARLLGDLATNLRFTFETAWGTRNRGGSDVFGTAYPYGGAFEIVSAYVEYHSPTGRGLRSVRAGRFRTPFGIAEASDHAYVGFNRPPLIRYGGYYGLSNGFLEHGVAVVTGTPRVSVETSVGRSGDLDEEPRRPGWNGVLRGQVWAGNLVAGVSYIDTMPNYPDYYAHGRQRFTGVDARWMYDGWMLRGEWIVGRPFDGTATRGGYVDMTVHRPALGPVTLVGRAERLSYDTPSPHYLYTHRYTGGTRVRIWQGLSMSVGVVHQAGQLTQRRATALDLGVSYAVRRDF